ncbi:MAG: hypothetical protein IJY08_06840 [Clostridia bacterium]|nr:hypothetical protein [Clostridia bacterium]
MMKLLSIINRFALNAADTAEVISQDVNIDFTRLPQTLKHMGVGMLSIFIVIGAIIAIIYLLNKGMASLEEKKKQREENDQ